MDMYALPEPLLSEARCNNIPFFTDDALFEACGVRIAFTTREGGVSAGPYDSLNLGAHVEDDVISVSRNRSLLMDALTGGSCASSEEQLIVPHQVHGDTIVTIDTPHDIMRAKDEAARGADALIVATREVAALLCFADCVPLIIVAPTGRLAVVHAGWRGAENAIAAKTLSLMLLQEERASGVSQEDLVAGTNVYIGPYIHRECFETNKEIHDLFVAKFGEECSFDPHHIDLGAALRAQLARIGVVSERICDINICTVCNNDRFFSYRAQDATAGRHGAFAIRM